MSESLEELKAILDNAPEGATHYDGKNYFTFVYGFDDGLYYSHWRMWVNHKQSMVVYQSRGINNIRSLSDIKRIIELMELNKNMHTTVAGYIYGKDWEHWNEFNAGKFKL